MILSKISYKYLQQCHITVSKKYFYLRIESHPDYPSLVALTDTLDEFSIKYQAVSVDKTRIQEVSFPFLAKTKKKKNDLEIVPSPAYLEANKNTFLENWEGVAIMVEPNQSPLNTDNANMLSKEQSKAKTLVRSVIIASLITSIVSLVDFTFFSFSFLWLSVIGSIVCSSIIMHKMGKANAITEKLCSSAQNSCNTVINSGHARIFKNIDVADIGLVYFLTLFLVSVFNKIAIVQNGNSVLLISCSLAFLVSLISLYYQWRIIKAWCKLCLLTVGIIWAQLADIAFCNGPIQVFNDLSYQSGMLFILAISISSLWFFVKPFFKIKDEYYKTEIKLSSWKRNPQVFSLLLKNKPCIDTLIPSNPFTFGSKDAPLHITMVSGPTCDPCAQSHTKLGYLFNKYPDDISYSIIFPINEVDTVKNVKTAIVEKLLTASFRYGNSMNILEDWYSTMNAEQFEKEYPPVKKEKTADSILAAYAQWSKHVKITHTPTFFINNHLLPREYNLADIESFISEIREGLILADTEVVQMSLINA